MLVLQGLLASRGVQYSQYAELAAALATPLTFLKVRRPELQRALERCPVQLLGGPAPLANDSPSPAQSWPSEQHSLHGWLQQVVHQMPGPHLTRWLAVQLYAFSFFLIPALRWLSVAAKNNAIDGRNDSRARAAKALAAPSSALRQKLARQALASWLLSCTCRAACTCLRCTARRPAERLGGAVPARRPGGQSSTTETLSTAPPRAMRRARTWRLRSLTGACRARARPTPCRKRAWSGTRSSSSSGGGGSWVSLPGRALYKVPVGLQACLPLPVRLAHHPCEG